MTQIPLAGAATGRVDRVDELHLLRVAALFELVNHYRDSLWPEFEIQEIPIAINDQDRQEYLIGHPNPPEEFRLLGSVPSGGQRIYLRDGCTIFSPQGGGWATDIGGIMTAYVGILQEGQTTDDYLSLLLHECFHVFQKKYHQRADSSWGETPGLDATYSALIGLESRILHEFNANASADSLRTFAAMFVAAREERRKDLSVEVILAENEEEFNEGTSTYIQFRLLELLSRTNEPALSLLGVDSNFNDFANAADNRCRLIEQIVPPDSHLITFFHAKYNVGMAECLALDRLVPDWKIELKQKGITPYDVLRSRLALPEGERQEILRLAKQRFAYDSIYADQNRLVKQRTDLLRRYLQTSGRRYRVYYSLIAAPLKWKPRGPVYQVPNALMDEIDRSLHLESLVQDRATGANVCPTLWLGGLERFEMGDLLFESKEVPILFRMDYIEWIDTVPAEDESDLRVEGMLLHDGVYTDLRVVTDGFILRVPRARIKKAKGVVAIIPEHIDRD